MGFDRDAFVAACVVAAAEPEPARAVAVVVRRTIELGSAIDDALGTAVTGEPDTLLSTPELTVQRIVWPGGSKSPPHEHRMWAVVGVYAGREVNELFERAPDRLALGDTVEVGAGEVLVLDVDAIHTVANPHRTWTAGLHVYGGDILGTPRSAWTPGGAEVSWEELAEARRAMFRAMVDLSADLGLELGADARHDALVALRDESERLGRTLSAAEARAVVAASWGAEAPT